MRLALIKHAASLNKAFRRTSQRRHQIELFKENLKRLFHRINEQESDEHWRYLSRKKASEEIEVVTKCLV